MRILAIADPKLPVPPGKYGGAERIIGYLCAEFQRLGHRVDLLAGPGSRSFGGKLFTHRFPSRHLRERFLRKLWFQALSWRAVSGADVVLNFGRLDYLDAVIKRGVPLVCRFGNPVSQSQVDWLLARRPKGLRLIGVSQHQIKNLDPQELWEVVHNGTDVERFKPVPPLQAKPYLVFLGRLTANKGADTAIRVARESGMKLILAGSVSDESEGKEFFESAVKPQLNSQIEWVGAVDDTAKRHLLGNARALLFPIRWQEPFANVVVESLACGAPVVASRCASTPEVIDHGKTGFLCDSEDEMVAAIHRLESLDRATCRRVAEERFSIPVMTQRYLRVMEAALSSDSAAVA